MDIALVIINMLAQMTTYAHVNRISRMMSVAANCI